jgi:hypothetical protein
VPTVAGLPRRAEVRLVLELLVGALNDVSGRTVVTPVGREAARCWIASGDRGAITFKECAGLPRLDAFARAPRGLPDRAWVRRRLRLRVRRRLLPALRRAVLYAVSAVAGLLLGFFLRM